MGRVLEFEITDGGLNAAFNPTNTGLNMLFSHIALGAGLNGQPYTPTGTETALKTEFMRRPVAGGARIASNEIAMEALFDGNEVGVIREVGLFTSTGVLFALWSAAPLGEKYAGVPYNFAATLVLDGINLDRFASGDVSWIAGGPSINIMIAGPLADIAIEVIRLQNRALQADVDRYSTTINATWP